MNTESLAMTAYFGLGAGLCSSALLLLDWLLVTTGSDSYLQVTHGKRTLSLLVVWFLGGSIVAGLGSLIHFYEQTPQAAVLIGLSWRTFFSQAESLIRTSREPVQQAGG